MSRLNSLLRKRHTFTPAERKAVWKADSIPGEQYAVCRYCGKLIHKSEQWHVAHERAWSRFGSNRLSNLGVAHAACNIAAKDKNMNLVQRISLRTWLSILLIFTALALALMVSVAITSAADAAPLPGEPTWQTSIAVRRAAIKASAKFGQTKAAHARCGPAIRHFGISLRSWNLSTVRDENRLGWQALRTCRK